MTLLRGFTTALLIIALMIFIPAAMAQDLTGGGGTPSASSGTAGDAFDDNAATDWQASGFASPAWIQWDFGTTGFKVVNGYSLQASSSIGADPRADIISWTFEASTTGSSWTTLGSGTGVTFNSGSTESYSVSNSSAYRYYRFSGISTTFYEGGGMMAGPIAPRLAEIQLMGTAGEPEISVQNGSNMNSGDTYDFGTRLVGTSKTNIFTVQNTGTNGLTVSTPTITGADASSFVRTNGPTSPILPGASSTFRVTYNVNSPGLKTALLSMDNSDADEDPFTITLTGNGKNNSPTITDIPNQVTDEDTPTPPIPFTVGDAEKPSDQLGVHGTSQNQALVKDVNVVINGLYDDRTVTLTPEPNAFGSTLISIYVSDGIENVLETFTLTVNPVNDPPVIITDLPDQTGPEDMPLPPLSFTVEDIDNPIGDMNLSGVSNNLDLGPLANITFTGLASAVRGDESIKVTGTSTVTVTPAPDQFGTATITVNVSDGTDTGSKSFDVNVTPVNDAPVVAGIPDIALTEDVPGSLDLDDFGADVDNADTELIWTVVDLDTATTLSKNALMVTLAVDVAVTIDPTTHVALFTPSANYNGPGGTFVFTATDPGGLADQDTNVVTVAAVNDAPVVAGIPDITFDEDGTASLDLDQYVTDVDHDTTDLTWTVVDLDTATTTLSKNGFMVIMGVDVTASIDAASHVVTFTATSNYNGPGGNFLFTATDPGGLTGQDAIVVTVSPVNDPPKFLAPLPPITLVQGQFYGFPIVILYPFVEDPDNPDPTLLWSVEAHPHLNPTFGPDSVKITAPLTWEGTYTLTVTISDGSLTDTAQLIITVTRLVDTTIPAAPTGLTVVIGANDVDISWNPNVEPDIAVYVVSRSTDSTTFDLNSVIGTVTHPTVTFNDNTITLGVTYYYSVAAVDASTNVSINNPVTRGIIVTGIEGGHHMPTEFKLGQNYPNPFNPTTTISYSLPKQTHVQIAIYNMTGQVMEMLVDQVMNTGVHTVHWDAASVPSGIYFYSIRTPEFNQVRKCMLMK